MDTETLAKELLRALRGSRSQAAFSRRLGYRTNVVHTWEAGRRWPTASETLRAAEKSGTDLHSALARFYRTEPAWLRETDPSSPAFVAHFLRDQQGETSAVAVAARMGRNRYSVARWLSGAVEPRLPDFLALVEATSLRLVDLVAALADPAAVPSITAEWARREAQRSLAIETPWAMAVLRALEVAGHGGDPARIAHALRLSRAEVDRCLTALTRAGVAREHEGRWEPVVVETIDTRRTAETARRLKGFWGGVGLERLAAGGDGAFAYNLMAVSHAQLRRLHDLHDAYFQAVRSVVAEEEAPECVALLVTQVVRVDGGQGGAPANPPRPRVSSSGGLPSAGPTR